MGKVFSKIYESLNPSVISRRDEKHGVYRIRSDHPECISLDRLALVTDSEHTINSSSCSVTPKESISNTTLTAFEILTLPLRINEAPPPPKCSDFYLACRNNKIREVKRMLETISQDEKDQLEPNGSTALHAAAYHGHVDIVRLLLESGADRSVQNKFQCLPFDEASTEEVKKLFLRIPNANRLIMDTGAIEWELVSGDALENAALERNAIKNIYSNTTGTTPIQKMFEKIQKNYIEKRLANTDKINIIKHFFEKATKEQDPIWIIKAYTAETDFYNVLNAEIATGASMYQNERKFIIALLSYHPSLDKLSYIGTSYRVMKVSDYEIQKYEINQLSMAKSFLSSSISEQVAVWYLCRQESAQENKGTKTRFNRDGKLIKSWVMCKYQIKHPRTALHIENSSQYPVEGEVLIMPYTVFKINNKRTMTASYLLDNQMITEIEFEECSSAY
jgi:hypothetical protein